jgi:hypothetical protein
MDRGIVALFESAESSAASPCDDATVVAPDMSSVKVRKSVKFLRSQMDARVRMPSRMTISCSCPRLHCPDPLPANTLAQEEEEDDAVLSHVRRASFDIERMEVCPRLSSEPTLPRLDCLCGLPNRLSLVLLSSALRLAARCCRQGGTHTLGCYPLEYTGRTHTRGARGRSLVEPVEHTPERSRARSRERGRELCARRGGGVPRPYGLLLISAAKAECWSGNAYLGNAYLARVGSPA